MRNPFGGSERLQLNFKVLLKFFDRNTIRVSKEGSLVVNLGEDYSQIFSDFEEEKRSF